MDIAGLGVSAVAGAAGGNGAGALMKDKCLGTLWKSATGIAGGAGVSALVPVILPAIGAILSRLVSGGAIVMVVVVLIKNAISMKASSSHTALDPADRSAPPSAQEVERGRSVIGPQGNMGRRELRLGRPHPTAWIRSGAALPPSQPIQATTRECAQDSVLRALVCDPTPRSSAA